jgi:hypothetical protein
MITGLSKLLDKFFVLGFYLPSLLGICGFIIANEDIDIFGIWITRAT